jgi:hypothetical protein
LSGSLQPSTFAAREVNAGYFLTYILRRCSSVAPSFATKADLFTPAEKQAHSYGQKLGGIQIVITGWPNGFAYCPKSLQQPVCAEFETIVNSLLYWCFSGAWSTPASQHLLVCHEAILIRSTACVTREGLLL